MSQTKTITVPKTMPLVERISEVNQLVADWLKSLDRPYNVERDEVRLIGCEKNGRDYLYHYEIHRKDIPLFPPLVPDADDRDEEEIASRFMVSSSGNVR
jgi:hypothetical protein